MYKKNTVKSLCPRIMIIILILSMVFPAQTAFASTGLDETVPDFDEAGEVVNDDFDNAIVVYTASYVHTQNITAASTADDDPVIPCSDPTRTDRQLYFTIWYSFTPLTDGDLTIDTLGSTGIDTVLAVWTGLRTSLTSVACNDDYNFPSDVQSKIQIPILEGETYYIEVAGNSLASVGTWVFNLSANVGIVAPTPIAPTGTINGVALPNFQWTVYPYATSYRLAVYSNTAFTYLMLDTVANSYCNSTQCSYPASTAFFNGDYKFKVLANTPSGATTYSDWMDFTITGVSLVSPIPISPNGIINGVAKPSFVWSTFPGATSYKLAVWSDGALAYLIQESVTTSSCDATKCTYLSPINLANGSYKFKVMASTSGGATPYSDWRAFTITGVTIPPPSIPPTLIAPNTAVDTHRPTFQWYAVENATFYRLAVYSYATGIYVVVENVYPSCVSGICSYTPFTWDLLNGSYGFKMRSRNSSGYTDYGTMMKFSVSSNLPLAPTLLAPTGTVGTARPEFQWNAVSGATKYRLLVYSVVSGIYVINTDVYPTACSGGVCSYVPSSNLASGGYKFKMMTYNSYGSSGYSGYMSFTVP